MNDVVACGLAGVIVDETAMCLADTQTDRRYYRGYPIEELAAQASCGEADYLVMHGELPKKAAQLARHMSLRRLWR